MFSPFLAAYRRVSRILHSAHLIRLRRENRGIAGINVGRVKNDLYVKSAAKFDAPASRFAVHTSSPVREGASDRGEAAVGAMESEKIHGSRDRVHEGPGMPAKVTTDRPVTADSAVSDLLRWISD